MPNTLSVISKKYLNSILEIYCRKVQRLETTQLEQDLIDAGFKPNELGSRVIEVKYFIAQSPKLLQKVIDKYYNHPNVNRDALITIFEYLVQVDDVRMDNEQLTSFLDDAWLINSICSKHLNKQDINLNLKRLNFSARTAIKLLTNNELNELEKIIQANRLLKY